ncbi:hypothetical protein [Lysobacter sp. Root690]|uniref:hypothetical protein n=1 Tax=Lysobacter sp. Root690 TaxID=1736588 RepID=UPI000A89048C|nr:hypothetical protein [Lysobacter sp. Root690]
MSQNEQTRLIGRMVAIEVSMSEDAGNEVSFAAASTFVRTKPFNEIDRADNGDQIP